MMKIALFQMRACAGDVEANLAKIEDAAQRAVKDLADLLIMPELAVPGYGAGDRMRALADTADGPQIRRLQAISMKIGIPIIAGFAEKAGDTLYNSAVFVEKGRKSIVYRKSHLYGPYEKSHFEACTPETVLFDIKGQRCGMLICYDVEFPENVRRLAQAGADLVLVPTALPAGDYGSFIARTLVPTRAFENQVAIAYANHAGVDDLFSYQGLSVIVAPDGTLLAEAGDKDEELLYAEVDFDRYQQSKQENNYLGDL
ncbi:MAG: carbon-nitrogen hydrolase family protein [Sneathiella sp.]